MYVILVYDMKQQRVGRMLKLCRRYLHWIQNSVFEGEISEVKLTELLAKARILLAEDSVIIFKSSTQQWLEKQVVGRERSTLDAILQRPLVVGNAATLNDCMIAAVRATYNSDYQSRLTPGQILFLAIDAF